VDFRGFAERSLALGALRLAGPNRPQTWRGVGKRLAGASDIRESQPWWPGGSKLRRESSDSRACSTPAVVRSMFWFSPPPNRLWLWPRPLAAESCGSSGKNKINERAEEIEQAYRNLMQALLSFQIDFDLGDEDLIEKQVWPTPTPSG
jgi:hypothetical protein